MNFFLVESPLQYLNAREAHCKFCNKDRENTLIIFRGASKKNLKQIRNLVEEDSWSFIYTIDEGHLKSKLYKCKKKLKEILTRDKLKQVHYVFIGEYRSLLMRNFVHQSNCDQSYLLDDGNASISIHKEIVSGEGLRNDLHPLRKALNWFYGLNDKDIWDIRFFTIYPKYTRDKDTINDYSLLKNKLTQKEVDQNAIWFLGNNITELGIIDRERYLSYLQKVIEYFEDSDIYYIPHRRENPSGFDEIHNLGFNLHLTDEPIETYLIKQNKLPSVLASFRSSALDNCYFLFGELLSIYAFSFNTRNVYSDKYRKDSKSIFDTYKKYDNSIFKVIEI